MARIVPIKNDDLRSLIALEGRPVNLSVGLEGDGSSLQATGTTSASLSYTITAVSSDTNAIITLGIPDSNLQVGDSITISGATGGGYTGLNGSREIVSVISDNKFSINVNSSGYSGAYDADSATLEFSHISPTYSSISTSSIDIDVGRAVAVTSITITSNVKGRVTGVIAQNAIGDWIGLSNQDEFSLAVGEGGTSTLNLDGLVLGSGSRVSLTFTPYSQSGQTNPDIGMHINGIEFTADFNFNAKKKLLYCGDSISWSLVGNWRPHDMGYNYSGNRRESINPYPSYFGDELAAFRLVNALRSQEDPESIRLVNKGFGGSKLATDQWFASRSGMYTMDWNMMVMQAGINDATEVQTPLRQLTMGQRIQDMVSKRNEDGRKDYPMVFCTPPIADDKYDGLDSRVCLDVRRPLNTGESYDAEFNQEDNNLRSTPNVNNVDLTGVTGNSWCRIYGQKSVAYTVNAVSSASNAVLTIPDGQATTLFAVNDTVTITGAQGSGYTAMNDTHTITAINSDTEIEIDFDSSGLGATYVADSARVTFNSTTTISGGAAGQVYRFDFDTDCTLLTGVHLSNPLNTNSFIRTWESQLNLDEYPINRNGQLSVDANTVLYLRCVTPDEEYEELDRARIIGSLLADDATSFDAENGSVKHFITGTNSQATEILNPVISGISSSARINNALASRNIAQFNCVLNISDFDLPVKSNVDNNDLWIKVEGMTNDTVNVAGSISWSNVNGFYQVQNYNTDGSGNNIINVQVLLDTRDAAKRQFSQTGSDSTNYGLTISGMSLASSCVVTLASPIDKGVGDIITIRGATGGDFEDNANGDFEITAVNSSTEIVIDLDSSGFSGAYTADSGRVVEGTITIFNSRSYIAQFEANTNNTPSNCSFFENGDNVVDGGYTIRVQMKDDTPSPYNLTYDATTGKVKAICFSVYQQGNVIFMNEVASGDVVPTGKVVGNATTSGFWEQEDIGKTRLQTVRETIRSTVNAYADSANVHLVDLYDIDDLAAGNIGTGGTPSTTETTGGRLIYGEANYKADTSGGASSRLLINDPIEDPIFKATGDSGINERVMGKRLHRSPKGHEEIFNRLYNEIGSITIPN